MSRFDEDLALTTRALEIQRRALGEDYLDTAGGVWSLGAALTNLRRLREALQAYVRATALFERAYGERHLYVGTLLQNQAGSLHELGRDEEALPVARRALEIVEAALGRGAPKTMSPRCEVAEVAYREGFAAGARDDPQNPDLSLALGSRAEWLLARGKAVEALEDLIRARAMRLRFEAEGGLGLLELDALRAEALVALGRREEAGKLAAATAVALGELFPAGHPLLADALTAQGAALLQEGDRTAAWEPLERAAAMRELGNSTPVRSAWTRQLLARAREWPSE